MKFAFYLIVSFVLIQGCNSKENLNPLIGKWTSNSTFFKIINPELKETHLEFFSASMKIDNKEIPVIYKFKGKQIVLFSRGERVVANIVDEGKMVLFLKGIGKKIYIKDKK